MEEKFDNLSNPLSEDPSEELSDNPNGSLTDNSPDNSEETPADGVISAGSEETEEPAGNAGDKKEEDSPGDKTDPDSPGISPEEEGVIRRLLSPISDYERSSMQKQKLKQKILGGIYEWLGSFVAALLFVVVLFTFVLRLVRVQGESMYPTLNNNDYLVITDLAYEPKTGDIVVLQVPSYKSGHPLIKRVIATGGQTVHIDFENWTVTVDGVTLDETYLNRDTRQMTKLDNCPSDFVVREGYVFVMGDNRNNSTDSRSSLIGQIDERFIMGRVVFRLFSLSPLGTETNPLLSPFREQKNAD